MPTCVFLVHLSCGGHLAKACNIIIITIIYNLEEEGEEYYYVDDEFSN